LIKVPHIFFCLKVLRSTLVISSVWAISVRPCIPDRVPDVGFVCIHC
jgi:hypothetical protein